ncbi:MAG: GUN4 domain-containing protein, partial [Cyanobacteria bacterium J06638_22]
PSLAKGRSEQPDSGSGIPPFEQLSAGKQAKIDAEVKVLHDLLERGDMNAVLQQLIDSDALEDSSVAPPIDTSVSLPLPHLTEAQSDESNPPSSPSFEQLSANARAKIDREAKTLHDLLERGEVNAALQKLAAPEPPEDSSAAVPPPKPSDKPTNNNGGVSAPDRPLPEEPPSAPPPPPSPAAPPEPVNPSPAPSSNDHGEGSFVPGYVPPPPHTSTPNDDLASDRNIEYTALQGLLQDGMWREADHETLRVMLLATNRTKDGWLSPEALAEFPCLDLQTISNLWEKYSQGHFGFIAQERIYDQFREIKMSSSDRRLIEVTLRLKWMWKAANFYPMFRQYKDLDFSLDTAITGHLPAMWFWKLSPLAAFRTGTVGNSRSFGGTDIKMLSNLMRRLRECNIQ